MAKTAQKPTAAFILSLLSGAFIILGGIISALVTIYWPWGGMGWMMNWWSGGLLAGMAYVGSVAGVILGVAIMVAAVMLYQNQAQHELLGALIIVFSVLSAVSSMGGFGIGLVLGIIGGVLAVTWKPE